VATTAVLPSGVSAKHQGRKACTETPICPLASASARDASSFEFCYTPGRC